MPKAVQKRTSMSGAPPLPSPPHPARTTDLIGLTTDGRLVLWQAAAEVRPISAFRTDGVWIISGHYVIEWKGHAITVHCANMTDGSVGVQFMCGALKSLVLERTAVEAMLLGEVIQSEESKAVTRDLLAQLRDWAERSHDAPHLQRGRLS